MISILAVFLLIPMTTGLTSYACKWRGNVKYAEHNITCDDRQRIHIISGYYGYTYQYFSGTYCSFNDGPNPDDCLLGFNATVHSDLVDSCDGEKRCNFQTPIPDFKYCSKEIDDNGRAIYSGRYEHSRHTNDHYTYSYIQYECLTVTTALPTRSTIPTIEQDRSFVTNHIYTGNSTIQLTKLDSSKPARSTESHRTVGRSGGTVVFLGTVGKVYVSDTTVIAGSVVVAACVLLLIILVIVVIISKRIKATCRPTTNQSNDEQSPAFV